MNFRCDDSWRLILKASDKAHGQTMVRLKIPPPTRREIGQRFIYEVDLAGTQGKSDKEPLDLLKQNGTQSYYHHVFAKDYKPDLTNLVATKDLTVNLNGLTTPTRLKSLLLTMSKTWLMFQPATW